MGQVKTAYLEYKSDLDELVTAYRGIILSDAFINILHRKADQESLKNTNLDRFLSHVVKIYPDRYVNDLFLVRLVTLLEEYLKNRLIEEFNQNHVSVNNFLLGYVTNRKLTVNDVIDGPQKLALSYLDGILFHNLPKVENVYSLALKVDIKKLCDFDILNRTVELRHLIVHDGSKERGSRQKINILRLQPCLDEINKLVENIEFSIANGRPKKVIKQVKIDGYDKSIFQEYMLDIIDYETTRAWGDS